MSSCFQIYVLRSADRMPLLLHLFADKRHRVLADRDAGLAKIGVDKLDAFHACEEWRVVRMCRSMCGKARAYCLSSLLTTAATATIQRVRPSAGSQAPIATRLRGGERCRRNSSPGNAQRADLAFVDLGNAVDEVFDAGVGRRTQAASLRCYALAVLAACVPSSIFSPTSSLNPRTYFSPTRTSPSFDRKYILRLVYIERAESAARDAGRLLQASRRNKIRADSY